MSLSLRPSSVKREGVTQRSPFAGTTVVAAGNGGMGSRLRGNDGGGRGNGGVESWVHGEGDETVAPYGPPTYDCAAHYPSQQMIAKHATDERRTRTSAGENLARLRRRQDRYLPKMMRLCAAGHPYYGPLMTKLGLTPDDFRTVEDLRKLPPLPKKEYANDPEAFRLDLEGVPDLSPEETTLADIVYTAGSTSKPAPFYDTVHDRFARVQLMGRAAAIGGVGPDDTVMNLFPLSSIPHQGFLSASWGAMASGAKLLTGLTGRAYAEIPVHQRMDEAIEVAERPEGNRPLGHHDLHTPIRDARPRARQGLQLRSYSDGHGRAVPTVHAGRTSERG